jgi:hypothetical protein
MRLDPAVVAIQTSSTPYRGAREPVGQGPLAPAPNSDDVREAFA